MIVDESSMIDIGLMLELLSAIPNGTNIIFIGDADQLPPVKSGQPFKDFIESERFEIARLTGNFRQNTFSETVKAARSIIQGQSPQKSENFLASDFVFFDVPQAQQSDKILQLYFESMPNKLGVQPTEIQILSPQRAGHVGINRLNNLIQNQTTRTSKPVLTRESGNKLIVEFEGESGLKEVAIVGKDKFDMEVAYATTIHSSQGSEYPGVIVPATRIIEEERCVLSCGLIQT
jgi:exodeoxyribonuclease V alpha subunit